MFFLLGGNEKKARKAEKQAQMPAAESRVRDVFLAGRFPVVTTHQVEGRRIAKVLGLVCCRGFDSEEAFFGMAGRAMNKGAQAIVGYSENVAFHPDGSKYFSCYGTAVMFEYDPADPDALPLMLQNRFKLQEQQPNSDMI
ncbi:YbjQ family protein [Desulfovibrio sp. ZJ369]|uniref:YbjQ family protein n=1 Tax=Desulfovibrio sp. ZJ369 TaxID=2709793 RepID=UPI0013ED947D|nr:YbjQ family protein [Desulfovibrio sp. ZJ369]